MKRVLFTIFGLVLFTSLTAQQDRAVRDTGGGGGGWLKDSLQLGRVAIDAAANTLSLTNLDSFQVRAKKILLWVDPDLNIKIDSLDGNEQIVINNRIGIDKLGLIKVWAYEDNYDPGFTVTDRGKIAYNNTDNVLMFRNNTQWVNVATADDIPVPGTAGHTIQDEGVGLTQRSVLNFVGAGVTATDGGTETTVTIPGASNTAKFIVVGDQTETLQNVNGSSTWEIFPSSSQVVNAGSAFSYNTSTDRITYTASTSGYVRIWFHYSFDTNSLANDFNVVMRKNGAETRAKSTITSNETGIVFSGSSETYIAVVQNDYFEIGGYFSGGSANMTLSELMWGAEFVGE